MTFSPAARGGAALAFLLFAGAGARADLIHWTYSWSNSPNQVLPTAPAGGPAPPSTDYISLGNEGATAVTGNSNIVATNLQVHSTAPSGSPDQYVHAAYTLQLSLQDESGATGSLSFAGELNGSVTSDSSNLKNTFTNQVTQTVVLGNHLYTVAIGNFTPPGAPVVNTSGSISAQALITVQTLPEPGSLALAGLGAAGLLGNRRLRRRAFAAFG
jgi:hypothetical protein